MNHAMKHSSALNIIVFIYVMCVMVSGIVHLDMKKIIAINMQRRAFFVAKIQPFLSSQKVFVIKS